MNVDLETDFARIVASAIDEKGICPMPGVAKRQDGSLVFAMCTDPESAFRWFRETARDETVVEIILGIDRFTKPHQGTEFADVLTVTHWSIGKGLRFGVINYQHKPRIVRPIDWNNHFWTSKLREEFEPMMPQQGATAQ